MKVSDQLRASLIKVASEQPLEKQAFGVMLGKTVPMLGGFLRGGGNLMRGVGSKMFGWLPKMFRGGSTARMASGAAEAEAAGLNAARGVGGVGTAAVDPWAMRHATPGAIPGAVGPGVIGTGSNWNPFGKGALPSAEQLARGTRQSKWYNPASWQWGARHYANDASIPVRAGRFLRTGASVGGAAAILNAPTIAQNAGELGAARALAEMKSKMNEGSAWDRFWRAMGYAYAPDEKWVETIGQTNPNVARAFQYYRAAPGAPGGMSDIYAALTGSKFQ